MSVFLSSPPNSSASSQLLKSHEDRVVEYDPEGLCATSGNPATRKSRWSNKKRKKENKIKRDSLSHSWQENKFRDRSLHAFSSSRSPKPYSHSLPECVTAGSASFASRVPSPPPTWMAPSRCDFVVVVVVVRGSRERGGP